MAPTQALGFAAAARLACGQGGAGEQSPLKGGRGRPAGGGKGLFGKVATVKSVFFFQVSQFGQASLSPRCVQEKDTRVYNVNCNSLLVYFVIFFNCSFNLQDATCYGSSDFKSTARICI